MTIHVHSFTNCIYSLLSNEELMIEENISMPYNHTPFIDIDNCNEMNQQQQKTASNISELHHGMWWINS